MPPGVAMHQSSFIFSNHPHYRLKRHLFFWSAWTFFQAFLYAFVPYSSKVNYIARLPRTLIDSVLFLPSHLFLAYALMYVVIPRYVVSSRYTLAACLTLLCFLATATIASITSLYIIKQAYKLLLPPILQPSPKFNSTSGSFLMGLLAGLRGAITIGGLAAAIKLMKHYYTEGQHRMLLQKEAAESQLQVLKAQVHPHFLFNTLNTIYAYTQHTSATASGLVFGLSDMLRYMLYECNQQEVALGKELKMLSDYIHLESTRYNDKLELNVSFPPNIHGRIIAPLILLPFVENAFKHGVSATVLNPWLHLYVTLDDGELHFQVINSKPAENSVHRLHGLGLQNVQRRLDLIYPGRHILNISDEGEWFAVELKLQLPTKVVDKHDCSLASHHHINA